MIRALTNCLNRQQSDLNVISKRQPRKQSSKTKAAKIAIALLCSVLPPLSISTAVAASSDGLYANQYLFPGQRLAASGCYYHLDMQSDGNLVVYAGASRPLWATNTVRRGAYAVMQTDGNLVVYNWNGRAVWSSNTYRRPGSFLTMQDDGNLVVYNSSIRPLWSSRTYQGESLGQLPCGVTSAKTVVEPNVDRPGGNYVRYYLNRASSVDCAYFCSQDSRCQAFTYVPPNVQASQAVCWLKSSVPGASYRSGMVSGRIVR